LSQSQTLREARIGLNLIDGYRLSVPGIVAPVRKDLQACFKWAPKRRHRHSFAQIGGGQPLAISEAVYWRLPIEAVKAA
jgi:hypothetical protein